MSIPAEHVAAWADAQKKLLRTTYDKAWTAGVANYTPDDRSDREDNTDTGDTGTTSTAIPAVAAGVGAAALIAARKYKPPKSPEPLRRAAALSAAVQSVDRCADEIAQLPDADALGDWVGSEGWRIDLGGLAAAWSGGEAGAAEAAAADSQWFLWSLDPDAEHHCDTCLSLADLPAQPLSEWPTPADGSQDCAGGCRCNLEPVDAIPGDTPPDLTDDQAAVIDSINTRQAAALAAAMPDAGFLE